MASKWKDVISRILAKAEDPATTEHERETYLAKAAELMAKFGIEESMLRMHEGSTEKVISRKVMVKGKYKLKRDILLNGISSTLGCRTVGLRDKETIQVFGFADDIDRVVTLYESVLVQMIISMSKAEKPAHEHGKSFNNAFLNGYVRTVLARIRTAYTKAKEEAKKFGSGMDLALRNQNELVIRALKEEFPSLTNRGYSSKSSSTAGYRSGVFAGNMADIGQARVGSTRRAIGK